MQTVVAGLCSWGSKLDSAAILVREPIQLGGFDNLEIDAVLITAEFVLTPRTNRIFPGAVDAGRVGFDARLNRGGAE